MANAIRCVNRRGLGPRVLAVVGVTLALGGPRLAEAHPEWSPIRVNRYAKIVLKEPGRVRLVYTLLYGDGPALPARKSVDLDANGRLDERERAMLGARAKAQVASGLRLSLDGRETPLPPPSVDVGLAGDAVAPQAFSIDLDYALDAAPGIPHTLVIDDRVEVASEGDSEVSLDDPGAAKILEMRHGRAGGPARNERVFTFRGPRFSALEDRTVTVRWEGSRASFSGRSAKWLGIAALVIAGLIVSGRAAVKSWRAARRQRSMKG